MLDEQGRTGDAPVPAAVTARGWFDYRHMFGLTDPTLAGHVILDCPAGASPFGAQARARGGSVTSVDPCYSGTAVEIRDRVAANLDRAEDWLLAHRDSIDWSYLGSPDAYIRASEIAADLFAADYARRPQHYRAASMPRLPFAADTFTLTLSGNFLFAYAEHLTVADHLAALIELVRVTCGEVRVHPLVDTTGRGYPHLADLRAALAEQGIATELRTMAKAWIRGGHHTLICQPAEAP